MTSNERKLYYITLWYIKHKDLFYKLYYILKSMDLENDSLFPLIFLNSVKFYVDHATTGFARVVVQMSMRDKTLCDN